MTEISERDSISDKTCRKSLVIHRSMTLSGELISLTRATGEATFTSTRLVAAVVILGGSSLPQGTRRSTEFLGSLVGSVRADKSVRPTHVLNVNCRLARLAYR